MEKPGIQFDQERAVWELRLHAENVLTNRVNFILVGQSLFAAAVATLVSTSTASRSFTLLFVSGGFITSCIFFLAGYKAYIRLGKVDTEVQKFFPFASKLKVNKDTISKFPSNLFLAVVLPAVFCVGWILVLVSL